MTPSVARNVIRMSKARASRVRTRISYMSAEQLERFLEAAKDLGPREYAMFLFGYAHGARISEICNLRISDLDFHNEQVHIARVKGSIQSTQAMLKMKGSPLFNEAGAFREW